MAQIYFYRCKFLIGIIVIVYQSHRYHTISNADIEKYRFDKIGLFIWYKTQINNRSARA
jgi:hypothetical protein